MHIVNMIGDFRVLVDESKVVGKWEAFKRYYDKYPKVWEKMLGYLYMVNLEGLEPMVETIDFDSLLERVEANIHKIEEIEKVTKEVVDKLDFMDEFEVYIGAGLGHVNGMALPGGKSAIYVGLECIGVSSVNYLVPHEVNHMIRGYRVKEIDPNVFKERVITEGLGTLYPILFNGEDITEETLAKVLLMPKEKVVKLLDEEVELTGRVFGRLECTLTLELMKEFFNYDADEKSPQLVGYFVGMRMIQRLVDQGESIQRLTGMSADEIITAYQKTL